MAKSIKVTPTDVDEAVKAVLGVMATHTDSPATAFAIAFSVLLECARDVQPESRESVLKGLTDSLQIFWAAWDEWEAADDDTSVN